MALSPEPTPYLFACIDPATGVIVGTIGSNGRRAKDFARATDTVCVRWRVEQAIDTAGRGWTSTEWHSVK